MSRPVAAQGLFSLGTSIAMLKVVQRFMEGRTPEKWWTEPHVAEKSSTYVIDYPVATSGLKEAHYQSLSWPQVLEFLVEQVEQIDIKIACVVLFLCVLGPLIWSLLENKNPGATGDKLLHSVATQTEQEPEGKEKIAARYVHYNPAERALLQFGRSKSESVLSVFRYDPSRFEYTEPEEDIDEVVAGFTPSKKPSQAGPAGFAAEQHRRATVKPLALEISDPPSQLDERVSHARVGSRESHTIDPSQARSGAEEQESSKDSNSNVSPGSGQASSVKSSRSLLSFKGASLKRASSAQSHTFLQIQISPRKTSHVEVQLNPEQVYSQPFTY